jgi:hypothetical protein
MDIDNLKLEDFSSLRDFQNKLRALGHFQTKYKDTDELVHHFDDQLDKLFAKGFEQLDPR